MDSRPPPPPHGASTPNSSQHQHSANAGSGNGANLPQGNYDIFVIPPHSAGSGFLYLPSLKPHRNSFLAGVASTLAAVGVWMAVVPVIKQWASSVAASGGMAMFMLVAAVGVIGWAYGKTQVENDGTTPGGGSAGSGGPQQSGPQQSHAGPPPFGAAGPKPSWQRATPTGASAEWEKARAETRKREEERRKREEDKRKQEEAEKERVRAREREAREKAARERVTQERLRRENEAKASKEKEPTGSATAKNYKKPTAHSYVGDDEETSYRPNGGKYHQNNNSQSSFVSGSSWAPSQSTARTTPPPSNRGPYTNKDPDKISIKAVYAFTDAVTKPVAELVSGVGSVTDGLILKMTTEGLFIDDDVRGVGQREWDIKAWTLKLVEVCCPQFASRAGPSALPARYSAKAKDPVHKFFTSGTNSLSGEELDRVIEDLLRTCKSSCARSGPSNTSSSSQTGELKGKHVLKASIRDAENKKYYFVIDAAESWKVAVGLQRLRRGSQVRSLGVSGLSTAETKGILASLGWLRE